jgi:hypothetical protein
MNLTHFLSKNLCELLSGFTYKNEIISTKEKKWNEVGVGKIYINSRMKKKISTHVEVHAPRNVESEQAANQLFY